MPLRPIRFLPAVELRILMPSSVWRCCIPYHAWAPGGCKTPAQTAGSSGPSRCRPQVWRRSLCSAYSGRLVIAGSLQLYFIFRPISLIWLVVLVV